MEYKFDNFVYRSQLAAKCTFSFKCTLPPEGDTIALPMAPHRTEWFFTLSGQLNWNAFEVVADRINELTLSVATGLFKCAKRIIRAVESLAVRFVRSNQRRGRRRVPMVPMALRL